MSSSAPSPRIWRGQTLEARSADRREQLIQAAFELLGTEGAAAVTMRAVCRGAQLSPRYFYESFPDRETLLLAVFDRAAGETLETAVRAITAAPDDPEQRARAAFDACTLLYEEDPRLGRILFRETLADPTLRPRGMEVLPGFVAIVTGQMYQETSGVPGVDPAVFQMTVIAISGALVSLFLQWLDGPLDIAREQLVDYCVRMVMGSVDAAMGQGGLGVAPA